MIWPIIFACSLLLDLYVSMNTAPAKGIGKTHRPLYADTMPRYAFQIEYDGKPFCGWQRQKEHPSVQQAIEEALRFLDAKNDGIQGAGRTDTGVHALGQVAHTDMTNPWDTFRLKEAVNYHLKPAPVSIVACAKVADDFHARFDALERSYLFRLLARREPAPLLDGRVWQVRQSMDIDAMQEGANHLLGRHDFTAFRSSICQANSPMRTLDELSIKSFESPLGTEIHFTVRARSFLHNQVRSFVGTLERVGSGSWDPIRVKEALESRDRSKIGPVSPPHGLYLASATYPENPFS
jgi:tRNA pseudouridine38-40 synthase